MPKNIFCDWKIKKIPKVPSSAVKKDPMNQMSYYKILSTFLSTFQRFFFSTFSAFPLSCPTPNFPSDFLAFPQLSKLSLNFLSHSLNLTSFPLTFQAFPQLSNNFSSFPSTLKSFPQLSKSFPQPSKLSISAFSQLSLSFLSALSQLSTPPPPSSTYLL